MTAPRIKLRKPHSGQHRLLEEAARFNVAACGRRFGKTEGALSYIAIPTAVQGHPVGWFAPSYKLLDEAWHMALELLAPLGKALTVSKQERTIRLPGGGRIDFWTLMTSTADRSSAGRGRKYKVVVVDEAAHAPYLEQDWTKSIAPTLVDLEGSAWMISTPWGMNYFHRLYLRGQDEGQPLWRSWQFPTAANPYIRATELASMQDQMPADAFAQEHLAEFLADAANPFGVDAIRASILDDLAAGPVEFWGVDLAKSTDWTVCIGLNDSGKVAAYQRWQAPWLNTIARVSAMIGDTPALVDATGVGDPIVEQLQQKCGSVEGFKFSSQSKQTLMEGLAVAIQQRRMGFPAGQIVHELEAFRYEYKPSGVRYAAPEGMHDDCVDSLALAVRCMETAPEGVTLSFGGEGDAEDRGWFADVMDDERIWT